MEKAVFAPQVLMLVLGVIYCEANVRFAAKADGHIASCLVDLVARLLAAGFPTKRNVFVMIAKTRARENPDDKHPGYVRFIGSTIFWDVSFPNLASLELAIPQK